MTYHRIQKSSAEYTAIPKQPGHRAVQVVENGTLELRETDAVHPATLIFAIIASTVFVGSIGLLYDFCSWVFGQNYCHCIVTFNAATDTIVNVSLIIIMNIVHGNSAMKRRQAIRDDSSESL